MTDDQIRSALVEALIHNDWADMEDEGVQARLMAGDLLSVVRSAQAEELRAVATDAERDGYVLRVAGRTYDVATVEQLRARADALDGGW